MKSVAVLRSLNILSFTRNFISTLSKFSFTFTSILAIFFILFNSNKFSNTTIQSIELSSAITYLTLFGLASFLFAYIMRPQKFKKELFDAKAFAGSITFGISFVLFGLLFQSFEGRIDPTFVTGILTEGIFLATFMYIVSYWEESIFRLAILEIIKSKTKDVRVVYVLGALIFALYHYFKYSGSISMLLFAFIAGLGFVYLNERDFGYIPSFPLAVALHMAYNLYVVGGLQVVFSSIGMM